MGALLGVSLPRPGADGKLCRWNLSSWSMGIGAQATVVHSVAKDDTGRTGRLERVTPGLESWLLLFLAG